MEKTSDGKIRTSNVVSFFRRAREKLSKRHQSVENFLSVKKGAKNDWPEEILNSFFLPLPPENRIQTNQKNTWRCYWELALKWPSINWFLLVFIVWVKLLSLTNKTKTSLSENIHINDLDTKAKDFILKNLLLTATFWPNPSIHLV